jgi:hypothetical protein
MAGRGGALSRLGIRKLHPSPKAFAAADENGFNAVAAPA